MPLTRVFLKRPTLVFVLVALTLLAGFFALRSLVVQEMPNTALPTISINVQYSGASTSELRDEVARPIEDQLAGTPYLDHLDTTIQTGSVNISAAFALQSTDTENIANVEKALQVAQRQLPSTITPPTIRVADPSEPNVVTLGVQSKKYDETTLGAIANDQVVPAIEQFVGVANAQVYGTTQAAIEVRADPFRLASSNLTLTDVVNSITPDNMRLPGGIVYQPGHETQIDVRGDVFDTASVANLPIHVTYAGSSAASATGGAAASGGASSGAGASSGTSGTSAGQGMSSSAQGSGAQGSATGSGGESGTGSGGESATGSGGESATVPRAEVTAQPASGAIAGGAQAIPQASATAPAAATNVGTSANGNAAGQAGSAAQSGSAQSGASTQSGGAAQNGTSGQNGGAAQTGAAVNSGAARASTSGTAGVSSSGGATTGSAATTGAASQSALDLNAEPNVPIDQPVNVSAPSTTGGSATTTTPYDQGVMPSVSSSATSNAAGTSLSPYSGSLDPWAVPSADKRIGDVATVLDGSVVQRVYESIDGRPGATVNVQKATTASEVSVADEVVAGANALRKQFDGINFSVLHVQSEYTKEQLEGVEHTLAEGVVLTAIVMLLFLQSWRNAVVVLVAIPTSLGVTLFAMKALNLTLDTISLLAMTLVIGILIDDSTVVLENVTRHYEAGEAPPDAALNGRSEIGLAAIVITLVDVIVFLPIVFVGGAVGTQLAEFGIVVSIATLTSLFVSFTVTPALAGLWSLKSEWKPPRFLRWFDDRFNALRDRYSKRWLPAAIARPWPVVIVSAALCVAAILLVPTGIIGEEYLPAGDQGIVYVQVTYPPGHPLDQTHDVMDRIESRVRRDVSPNDMQSETTLSGGFSAPYGGFVQEGNVGQMTIFLSADRKTSTNDYVTNLQRELPRLAPGASVVVSEATQQGGGHQQPIDELVSTTNGQDPSPLAARVFGVLKTTKGATAVADSASTVAPQVEVDFDRVALQSLDTSIGTAATAVEAAFAGAQATQFETADKGLVYVEVIYPRSAQGSLDEVRSIPIRAQSGAIVRLGDVAHLHWAPTPLVLTRENRQDVVHVSANVDDGASLSQVTKAFLSGVKGLHLPASVHIGPAAQGQQDLMVQALVTLGGSLAGSILLVFFLIVALYNSYRTPFVTLFAIPLATIGAFGALLLTRQTLNLYSLIGMVLLVGLVTKNGILLVDYADTLRDRGKSREEAIREAATVRFRPIMMTTIAMIAGMLPLALGLNPGGATRASLGIAVIGGLLTSLVLTLVIVPIMYGWLAPKQRAKAVAFADEQRTKAPDKGPAPATA